LEVAVETKLFPDSALRNSLCNGGYKTKSEKTLFKKSFNILVCDKTTEFQSQNQS
jgi:hypothetical protein